MDETQKGWWSVHGISGTREGVAILIDANDKIPAHAKAFLKAEIASIDPQYNIVKIDAHYHTQSDPKVTSHGSGMLHFKITPSTLVM